MTFFRVLLRIYGKESLLSAITCVDKTIRFSGAGATPVHKALASGHYNLVNSVFIDELGFDTDFYTPDAKQTLIHTLIRSRGKILLKHSPEARSGIVDLVSRCSNLSLRDNQGHTILQLIMKMKDATPASNVPLEDNIEFFSEVVSLAIFSKWKSVCFLMTKLNE